jgi:hypothetical protein
LVGRTQFSVPAYSGGSQKLRPRLVNARTQCKCSLYTMGEACRAAVALLAGGLANEVTAAVR